MSLTDREPIHVDVFDPDGVRRLIVNSAGDASPPVLSALERVHALIDEAAAEAARTCEQCGGPGRQRPGGWNRTLCDRYDAARPRGWTLDEPVDGP